MGCNCGRQNDRDILRVLGDPNGATPVKVFVNTPFSGLRPGETYTQVTGTQLQNGLDWGYLQLVPG